jgi:hypothetical protein
MTCDQACAGNIKEYCGGFSRIDVYTIFQTTSGVHAPTTLVSVYTAVESTGTTSIPSSPPSTSTLIISPTSTPSPSPFPSSSKTAIGVGVGVGVPFCLGLLGYLLYRRDRKHQPVQIYGGYSDGGQGQMQEISLHELPTSAPRD